MASSRSLLKNGSLCQFGKVLGVRSADSKLTIVEEGAQFGLPSSLLLIALKELTD